MKQILCIRWRQVFTYRPNAWNDVRCFDKCGKTCDVKHCMCVLPAINKRCYALWRYVNSRLESDHRTSFQAFCRYVNSGPVESQEHCYTPRLLICSSMGPTSYCKCSYLKKEFPSCPSGPQWCGIFYYY